ncbi:hypothetical protein LX32DRAFT_238032 [Colletotrichum zoysiae]|uniref:Uncharacterized protein n=1 Tax=Colletotrichum zoysiae TaxID=1216348 RepID=A0AAD9HQ38_9PEZI|nr:hypothetical protein LX32DRAFT_238032 [Colletotrichum zoysiae]
MKVVRQLAPNLVTFQAEVTLEEQEIPSLWAVWLHHTHRCFVSADSRDISQDLPPKPFKFQEEGGRNRHVRSDANSQTPWVILAALRVLAGGEDDTGRAATQGRTGSAWGEESSNARRRSGFRLAVSGRSLSATSGPVNHDSSDGHARCVGGRSERQKRAQD